MRAILRVLGPRVGIAVGLIIVVGVVVTVSRLAGEEEPGAVPRPAPVPTLTVDPTAGDDGVSTTTPTARADDPRVLRVARNFADAWVRRDLSPAQWHASIIRYTTDAVAAELDGVDPSAVPASRAVGEPTITVRMDTYARVTVPMDTGILILRVFAGGERWRVGGVDWEPS